MVMLDADREPTVNDLRRMSLINDELLAFESELKLRAAPAGGSA